MTLYDVVFVVNGLMINVFVLIRLYSVIAYYLVQGNEFPIELFNNPIPTDFVRVFNNHLKNI